ncbi:MAG: nucleotidyltransferase [Ignisphaera sp.]|uniref:Nucleotidyltransferase n=1 Tax=Ignisphaera aggregans TaxID=334771 RepID=A0A7J3I640_9CREN
MLGTYTFKHIAKAIEILRNIGIDGIIIGSTCLDFVVDRKSIEGDIDLFVTSLSLIMEEEKIYSVAEENSWAIGTTSLGTPSITMNIYGSDITVDLYENVMDFYIPAEVIDLCKRIQNIDGVEVAYTAIECWMVLKARRGADQDIAMLSTIKELYDRNEINLDLNLVKKIIEIYEEDSKYIYNRLRGLGFKI